MIIKDEAKKIKFGQSIQCHINKFERGQIVFKENSKEGI